jgi:hypothetical protein
MTNQTKLIATLIGLLITLIVMLYPVGYWLFNSEYTSMGIFLNFWYLLVPGAIVFMLGLHYSSKLTDEIEKEKEEEEK